MVLWGKQTVIVHALKFKKGVAHMPIRSYGFSNIQNEAAYTDILEKAKNWSLAKPLELFQVF